MTNSDSSAFADDVFRNIERCQKLFGPLPIKEFNAVSGLESLPTLYWGMAVQPFSEEDRWLCWALEDYSRKLLSLHYRYGKEALENSIRNWPKDLDIAGHMAPIPLAFTLDPQDGNAQDRIARARLAVSKGTYLMHCIHQDIGDAAFLQFLQTFQRTFAWKRCITANLPMLLRSVSGRDYSKLVQECIWGTAMPDPRNPFSTEGGQLATAADPTPRNPARGTLPVAAP